MEVINQAEGIIHDTEAKIDEYKDQLPSDEVTTHSLFLIDESSFRGVSPLFFVVAKLLKK